MVINTICFIQTVYFVVPENAKDGDLIIYDQNGKSINIGSINIYEPPIDCSIYGSKANYSEQEGECYCQWGYKWNSNKTFCVESAVVIDNTVISNDTDGDGIPDNNDFYPNKKSEIITKNYSFNYILLGENNGKRIDIKVEVPKDLYLYYQNQNHIFSANFNNITSFITYDDLVIKNIAHQIEQLNKSQNFNPIAVAYQLVSQIVYTSDKFSIKGWDEYPKYPIETIIERSGDCEDTTFLMAALLKALNLGDPWLVRFDDHIGLAAFVVDNQDGQKDIFYIETTGNGIHIPGIMPEALVGKKYTLHALDEYKREKYISQNENIKPNNAQTPTTNVDMKLSKRVAGKLLLQVEARGAIWYVDTTEYNRYSVTWANALPLFRKLSLGITDADLAKIPVAGSNQAGNTAMRNRLKGKLLLQVQQGGNIWYVDHNGYRHSVTWNNLLPLFQSLALGITNDNLYKISEGSL